MKKRRPGAYSGPEQVVSGYVDDFSGKNVRFLVKHRDLVALSRRVAAAEKAGLLTVAQAEEIMEDHVRSNIDLPTGILKLNKWSVEGRARLAREKGVALRAAMRRARS